MASPHPPLQKPLPAIDRQHMHKSRAAPIGNRSNGSTLDHRHKSSTLDQRPKSSTLDSDHGRSHMSQRMEAACDLLAQIMCDADLYIP